MRKNLCHTILLEKSVGTGTTGLTTNLLVHISDKQISHIYTEKKRKNLHTNLNASLQAQTLHLGEN